MEKYTTYTDVLDFGKFKGKTIEEVLEIQPTYLRWMEDETDLTDFTEEVKVDIDESCNPYDPAEHLDMWDFCHDN